MLLAPGIVRSTLPQQTLRAARLTPTARFTRSLHSSAKVQNDNFTRSQHLNDDVSRGKRHFNSPDRSQRKRFNDGNQPRRRPEPLDNDKGLPTGVIPRMVGDKQVRAGTPPTPFHVLSLADLSVGQIENCIRLALKLKIIRKTVWWTEDSSAWHLSRVGPVLETKTIALMFSKRSTRTRVASETSIATLGGTPMFLGPQDIQLGVNETLYDTAKVVSSMVDGIMARVGGHDEIQVCIMFLF